MVGTCEVRSKLEELLDSFPPYLNQFDTTYKIGDDRCVAVSVALGHSVSYHGPEGLMVVHRSNNGDIIFNSCTRMGNVEGVSRRGGTLQGVDKLPRGFVEVIDNLVEANSNK